MATRSAAAGEPAAIGEARADEAPFRKEPADEEATSEPLRQCSDCGATKKLLTDFHKSTQNPMGRMTQCRVCYNRKVRELGARRRATNDYIAKVEKSCSGCDLVLPLTSFHKRNTAPDGHHDICRDCKKGHHAKIMGALCASRAACGHTCGDCGKVCEDEELDFAHWERGTKCRSKNGWAYKGLAAITSKKALADELSKGRWLCWRCHALETWRENHGDAPSQDGGRQGGPGRKDRARRLQELQRRAARRQAPLVWLSL